MADDEVIALRTPTRGLPSIGADPDEACGVVVEDAGLAASALVLGAEAVGVKRREQVAVDEQCGLSAAQAGQRGVGSAVSSATRRR